MTIAVDDMLISSAAGGDEGAWTELWLAIEPTLSRLARSPRVSGRLSQSEDECRNIVVEVMARLRDDGFRRLRLFLESRRQTPELAFEAWLRVVARRVIMHHVNTAPRPPSHRGAAVPRDLEELILECLEKEQRDRPRSADVLRARLISLVSASGWAELDAERWWRDYPAPPPFAQSAGEPSTLSVDLSDRTEPSIEFKSTLIGM